MGYEAAINKSWDSLLALKPPKALSVKFLADEYSIFIGIYFRARRRGIAYRYCKIAFP